MIRVKVFLAAMLSLVAAGCAVNGSPEPVAQGTDESIARSQATVAVVQCLIDAELIPEEESAGRSWFQDGKVVPDGRFTAWLSTQSEAVYAGKRFSSWEDEATSAWPNWKCPFPSSSPG